MKTLVIFGWAILLAGCVNIKTKKDLVVDDRKYDLLVNLAMKNGNMDISCKQLNEEINIQLSQNKNFELVRYNRFTMTDGIRFFINMNYNLIPSQNHQDERYKEAYLKVVDTCRQDENLSYLNALALALSSLSAKIPVNEIHKQ